MINEKEDGSSVSIESYKSFNFGDVQVDFESIFVNMIVGSILNHEYAKKNYVRILSIVLMKIEGILKERIEDHF